jgi:cytochrome c biogenesis DsbD-like protein
MTRFSRNTGLLFLTTLLLIPVPLYSTPLPQSAGDVKVSGSVAPDKVKRGRTAQANVVMEIPSGLHVQSNRPLDKFLVATKLEIEAPQGLRVGPVVYPRSVLRNLKFSKERVAVFEGRTVIRFGVTVPANFGSNSAEIKARLKFQACNDDACFPPLTREVKVRLTFE